MRTVHESGWVHGKRTGTDTSTPSTHEVATDVEEDLVGIYVRMVVWNFDSRGIEIKRTRYEAAHNETLTHKGLVHGRWLVDPANDGFKIGD